MLQETFRSWGLISVLLAMPNVAWADWEPTEIIGLTYPRLALQARVTGIVIVRVSVDVDGSVKEVVAVSGHPLLAQAARNNARGWKFKRSDPSRSASPEVFLVYRFTVQGNCAGNECRETFCVEYPNFVVLRSEMPPIQVHQGKSQ